MLQSDLLKVLLPVFVELLLGPDPFVPIVR